MKSRFKIGLPVSRTSLVGAAMIGCLITVSAQRSANRVIWLDRPLANWNTPGLGIPKPPSPDGQDPNTSEECRGSVRSPATAEDRAISRAGWILFGAQRKFGGTLILSAMSSVDGMCRPLGYQDFVFVEGRLAGTVSPLPMEPRTDGAEIAANFSNELTLNAEFTRYAESDPLCCPSRTTRVIYAIEKRSGGPVLVPKSVQTMPR